MPVRLNGIIAAPEEGGPYPVVVILHGNHPGCPVDEMSVDRWPCAADVEQPNYRGFAYLVRELADKGYVALSININAENTFGFGEPVGGERLGQLVDLHLQRWPRPRPAAPTISASNWPVAPTWAGWRSSATRAAARLPLRWRTARRCWQRAGGMARWPGCC